MTFSREISTDAYLGTFSQSTEQGEKLGRVLSLVDKLYRNEDIDVDMWIAGGILRNMIMNEMGGSQGVMRASSSLDKGAAYDGAGGGSNATTKADRWGRMHTGFEIQPNGEIIYAGGRRSLSNERALEDAFFAACGVHSAYGQRKVNIAHAKILIAALIETERMPTLAELTTRLTPRYGAKSKQAPPYAFGVLELLLGRLVLYFKDKRWVIR